MFQKYHQHKIIKIRTQELTNFKIINVILFLTVITFPLQAEDLTLNVTGIGATKSEAIQDAQRNALRTSYGEFVSTNLTVLNNQLTKNETINLVSGTIKDFVLLSESINDFAEPPIIEVLLKVTVNRGQLVSFAKAIGDDVQVQGSLFGAEIRQQEMNKKNEVIALEHLFTKAKQMSSFFDYELQVGTPQQSKLNTENYVVDNLLILKPNKNYTNLTNTVRDTIQQISMDGKEREKFDELNVPFYKLDIMEIKNANCLHFISTGYVYYKLFDQYPKIEARLRIISEDQFEDFREVNETNGIPLNQMIIKKNKWNEIIATCEGGTTKSYYLRTKEAKNILASMNHIVHQSAVNYEVFRQTSTARTQLFPFSFNPPRWEWLNLFKSIPINQDFKIDPEKRRRDNLEQSRGRWALTNLVMRNMPDDDKKNVLDDEQCREDYSDHPYFDICFDDGVFDYDYMKRAANSADIGIFTPEGFFSASSTSRISGSEERVFHKFDSKLLEIPYGPQRQKFMGKWKKRSAIQVIHSYNEEGRFRVNDLGIFHIYPNNAVFAELVFEDIVSTDILNNITAYTVDPDNPTKYEEQ